MTTDTEPTPDRQDDEDAGTHQVADDDATLDVEGMGDAPAETEGGEQ